MASSPLENDIHEAILLACDDMSTAGEVLETIRTKAISMNDKAGLVACLKVLSVVTTVTGRTSHRRRDVCRELVREDPKNPSNWISLGNAEEELGSRNDATTAYDKALKLAKGDARSRELILACLERVTKSLSGG